MNIRTQLPALTGVFILPLAVLFTPQETPRSSTLQVVSSDMDMQTSTPDGAVTVTVPAGWSMSSAQSLMLLQPPEMDSRFVLAFDIGAVDAQSAVNSAWAVYRPDFKRPLQVATPRPARNGWEEVQAFIYETSPNEHVVIEALARRVGTRWVVAITDASASTMEKRDAQIRLYGNSVRPKGYARESFAGRKAAALDSERIAELRHFVESSMQVLGIPGASMALIDGGKVVFEGGFGVRELGKPDRVDADTLFLAASNTKAMTTLLLALLADEQRLMWDQPVKEIYPKFKLGDESTTSQVLVKHLVCACTGLPRQDMEWIFESGNATPLSSLELLGTMQPTSRFGELYQYSNLMAAAAGYIGGYLDNPEAELGAAYDEAMQKRIFDPLGMNSTTFNFEQAQKRNHARPHSEDVDGKTVVSNMALNYAIIPHRPAGGVWTSAHDLIRYAQLELNRGKLPNGKVLVSEENLLARRQPMVPTGANNNTYGMGLMTINNFGIPVVHHGGSLLGYKSDFIFLPDHGIGAVLLTNAQNGDMLLQPFSRRLLEVVFDGEPRAVENVQSQAANAKASHAKLRERLVVPADPQQVAKLAAHYSSSSLGEINVRQEGTTTVFDFGEWRSAVASRKNDDGSISFIAVEAVRYEFVVGAQGGKRILVLRDAQHEYVFTETS